MSRWLPPVTVVAKCGPYDLFGHCDQHALSPLVRIAGWGKCTYLECFTPSVQVRLEMQLAQTSGTSGTLGTARTPTALQAIF